VFRRSEIWKKFFKDGPEEKKSGVVTKRADKLKRNGRWGVSEDEERRKRNRETDLFEIGVSLLEVLFGKIC
jgi:hypothetical protein